MIYTYPRDPTADDVLVMYLVVKESLNMSAGKVGAQCGHAIDLIRDEVDLALTWEKTSLKQFQNTELDNEGLNCIQRYKVWKDHKVNGGFRKVVLKADDKEWEKIKQIYNPIIVVDAGLTEVLPNSETVMVLWPMFKDERDKTLKRLQALK